ncbi:cysteine--tRNA ligase [Sphingomonas bacterium]|uniref:cysteine--tRNA ligase n=1 Tax=Sphingomonas bacterium TaxID=1895847 RepID=UPI0015751EE3|nr:cysteine--tRNA ligase [Sphingomonas bacterium]
MADRTMPPLVLFNSLSRQPEAFRPIDPADVRVYTCGPTVYADQHVGNMRAFLFADTLVRTLRARAAAEGWGRVRHVINITDVGHLTSDADAGDDKMERAAASQGRSIWDLAARYTADFRRDVARLGIAEPSIWAVATDHIAEMVDFAAAIAPAHCYTLPGGLYFDTGTVPDYGRLARAGTDGNGGGDGESRIDAVVGKRHPQDFAIWRISAPGEDRQMEWDSPWGRGAPGWHLECSVMSRQYLGSPFDIHTGGIDHREIHHPNEIAQNQARCGCADPGATFWLHNNFLVQRDGTDTGKMSKSSGAITTLQSLVDRGIHPLGYRLMCLQAHYRSELEFSWSGLVAALTRLRRLVQAVEGLRSRPGGESIADAGVYREQLDAAMAEDLNTPRALTALESMLADERVAPAARIAALADFDAVLGLNLGTLAREDLRIRPATATIDVPAIAGRLADRRKARGAKDFARSDAIRNDLHAAGIEVMDGDPLGWDWRLA